MNKRMKSASDWLEKEMEKEIFDRILNGFSKADIEAARGSTATASIKTTAEALPVASAIADAVADEHGEFLADMDAAGEQA